MPRLVTTTLICFGLMIFVGCDSTDTAPAGDNSEIDGSDENPGGGEQKFIQSTMIVNIDGRQWGTTNVMAITTVQDSDFTLEISGISEAGDELSILFVGDIEKRTYGGGDGNLVNISFIESGASQEEIFVSVHYSTVTITDITTTRLAGTFVFEGTRSSDGLGITGKRGSFNVEYNPNR